MTSQKSNRKPKIENMAAGIVLRDGKFLVEKRRLDKEADPGYVEIPGGHAEPGETIEQTLRREMKEELGITVLKERYLGSSLATATNGERGRIHYFLVEEWKGEIVSNEAERVYWESDVANLSIRPDRSVIKALLGSKTDSV